jgi:dGTPase
VPLFGDFYAQAEQAFPAAPPELLTNEALKKMLNSLVTDLLVAVVRETRSLGIETLAQVRQAPLRIARLSPEMEDKRMVAKRFLYTSLYESPVMAAEHIHAGEVIHTLFTAWTRDPLQLPPDHLERIQEDGLARTVADYIAGMTDSYIEQAWVRHREESRS